MEQGQERHWKGPVMYTALFALHTHMHSECQQGASQLAEAFTLFSGDSWKGVNENPADTLIVMLRSS